MNNEIKDIKQNENDHFADTIKHSIPALVLIVIGGGLLASNFLNIPFHNWWVLFLVTPVVFMSYQVWRDYNSNGRLTSRSVGPLIGSLVLITMMATFVFDLNWGQLWPISFIFGGIAILLGRRTAEK